MKLVDFNKICQEMRFELGVLAGSLYYIYSGEIDLDQLKNRMLDGFIHIGGNDGLGIYLMENGEYIEVSPTKLEDTLSDINSETELNMVTKMAVYNGYTTVYNALNAIIELAVPLGKIDSATLELDAFHTTIIGILGRYKLSLDMTSISNLFTEFLQEDNN